MVNCNQIYCSILDSISEHSLLYTISLETLVTVETKKKNDAVELFILCFMSISNTQRHFLLHVASNSFISLGTKEQKKLKEKIIQLMITKKEAKIQTKGLYSIPL